MYQHRQDGKRLNLGIRNGENCLFLYRMSDQPITKYRSRKPPNPYISEEWGTLIEKVESPLNSVIWLGNAENNEEQRERKALVKAERGEACECCGSQVNLDLHHLKARRIGGQTVKENVQLLCRTCHAQTPSFGEHSRLQ
ncbi:MAG: HNH endonuclease signature motif containing protein [Cyanobacteria bacterium P01_F01_bin.150]